MRRIFLKKMPAADRDLVLVAPGAAKLEQVAREDRSGITIYQQFGEIVGRHPFAVVVDNSRRMRRRAIDRDLTRELKSWAPVFTDPQKGSPINRHFGFG